MTIYNLDILFSQFGTSLLFISSSNCCFLTCIQISQEAGKVDWYSHLLKNFPQFIVIHTVKTFSLVNKAEVDVSLELSCFFDDLTNIGNLIFGNSAFSKSSLNIWMFMVHVLLNSMKRQKDRDDSRPKTNQIEIKNFKLVSLRRFFLASLN